MGRPQNHFEFIVDRPFFLAIAIADADGETVLFTGAITDPR